MWALLVGGTISICYYAMYQTYLPTYLPTYNSSYSRMYHSFLGVLGKKPSNRPPTYPTYFTPSTLN